MRISDWSSDVCSSDLLDLHQVTAAQFTVDVGTNLSLRDSSPSYPWMGCMEKRTRSNPFRVRGSGWQTDKPWPPIAVSTRQGAPRQQNGRASRRESVRQNVSIMVGAE